MAGQKPTILVVDDDTDDLDKVEKALEPIHIEIDTLQDPHRVLQVVESTSPHLLILDALLPGLSGFDLCKQIKTSAGTKKTTVLILTGVYLKDRYRREAIHQFKADGFATKPFRDRELQRLVLQLLADKLKMTPSQLQDRLVHSKEIFTPAEKNEKPGILGRIFGRLRSTPAQSVSEGFLHTAPGSSTPSVLTHDESTAEETTRQPSKTELETEASELQPDVIEAETRPDMVQAEPGPETIQEGPSPDTTRVEAGPETVQTESEPEAAGVEPGPDDTVQAEVIPEALRAEIESDGASAEPQKESEQVQAETEEEDSITPAASPGAELDTGKTEETPETPAPELVEQLDGEANATIAEIVKSELDLVPGEDELPDGTPVEAPESPPPQSAAAVDEPDRASPASQERDAESEEATPSDAEPIDEEVGSDLNAAKAVFDALGPVPRASTGEFKLSEGEEKEPESKAATPEPGHESAKVAAESAAPAEDEPDRDEHHVVREEEEVESSEQGDGRAPSEVTPEAVGEELPIYPEEAFLHELRREVMMCRRVDRPLTLILIRIADLGQIVELFGKDFRPKVMRHVAIQAIESLREVDIVGLLEAKELLALTAFASDRYGGERIVSRLQATLGRNPFQVGEGIPSFIPKLRFGMAAYPKEAASSKELLERAEDEVEPSSPST